MAARTILALAAIVGGVGLVAACAGAGAASDAATRAAGPASLAQPVCHELRRSLVPGELPGPWERLARLRLQLDAGVEPAIQILRAGAPGPAASPAGARALHLLWRWRAETRGVLRAVAEGARPARALATGAATRRGISERIAAELTALAGPECAGAMTAPLTRTAPPGRDVALAYASARVRLPQGADASARVASAPALRRAVAALRAELGALARRSVAPPELRLRRDLLAEGRRLAAVLERAAGASAFGRPPPAAVREALEIVGQPFLRRALSGGAVAVLRPGMTGRILWRPSGAGRTNIDAPAIGVASAVGLGSAAADDPSSVPCRAEQLALKPGRASVATGHYKRILVFTHVLAPACRLRGYPGIQLIDGRGRPIRTRAHRGGSFTFPALAPRTVVLRPGARASFALGGDNAGVGGRICPSAAAIQVIPPNTSARIALRLALPACGGRIDVSAVVAGSRGPEFNAAPEGSSERP
jgi:hypothetical protein